MKSLHHVVHGGLLLCTAMFLFSCKKQITEPQANENSVIAAASSASAACKPTVFAALTKLPNDQTIWTTLFQRWYDGQGKLRNFKASITTSYSTVFDPGANKINWGVVSYEGNQVYVHDNGKLVLRVTMDAQNRPEASYFYSPPSPDYSEIDTSYYFYTGDKLTQIYSIKSVRNSPSRGTMYNLAYDMYGNIIKIFTGNSPNSYQAHYKYDYNKPTNRMMAYNITQMSIQVMEYIGLINLPMQHELVQTRSGAYSPGSSFPFETFPVYGWDYKDHVQSGGYVTSYQSDLVSFRNTFYTGWDCGSSSSSSAVNRATIKPIESLEDFKQQFK